MSTKCKPWERRETGQTQDTGWVGPGTAYTAQVNGIQKVKGGGGGRGGAQWSIMPPELPAWPPAPG